MWSHPHDEEPWATGRYSCYEYLYEYPNDPEDRDRTTGGAALGGGPRGARSWRIEERLHHADPSPGGTRAPPRDRHQAPRRAVCGSGVRRRATSRCSRARRGWFQLDRRAMVIRQGDIFWLKLLGIGSEPAGRRPAIVVQADHFNRSAINTAVVAAITSNLRLGEMPGNVRLRKGEANLPKPCVVNVSQLLTIDRSRLTEPIGTLRSERMREVVRGLALLLGTEA